MFRVGGQNYYTHIIAYEQVHGPVPPGKVVRHRCDNPPCRNVDHLLLGTHGDNVRDCIARGRFKFPPRELAPKGDKNGQAKLTDKQTAEIKAELRDRPYYGQVSALARRYGISQPRVSAIKKELEHV